MKTNKKSTNVADDQGLSFSPSRRNFIRIMGSVGITMFFSMSACVRRISTSPEKNPPISDHFNGTFYFNPGSPSKTGDKPKRGVLGYLWYWLVGNDYPVWPEFVEFPLGPTPEARVPKGTLRITYIGHSSFLIQMDGLNILTDPVWSDRCSPFSWVGPKRHSRPGLRLEDLPPIDAVLLSHNHYDHLDLPTLKQLGEKGTPRCLVPLDNGDLVRDSGIPNIDELDWWQSARLSEDLQVTLVQAQHFSSRNILDSNKALWGGFVLSGPSGNVYFSGDTGYGPHFQEIGRRFAPINTAILPISPFQPKSADKPSSNRLRVHMRSREAVKAHLDLGAEISIAAHFRVFQLGPDGFDDAAQELAATLKKHGLKPEAFIALNPGQGHG